MTPFVFMLVLEDSRCFYEDKQGLYTCSQVNLVFAGYKKGYCVLEYYIQVDIYIKCLCWCELLLEWTGYIVWIDLLSFGHFWILESGFTAFLDIVHLLEQTVQLCKLWISLDRHSVWLDIKRIAGQGHFVLVNIGQTTGQIIGQIMGQTAGYSW